MRKLIGSYSILESLISILIFGIFVKFNHLYFSEIFSGSNPNNKDLFLIVFVDLVLLTVISLPAIGRLTSKISNESIERFLAFPKKDDPFTFPVLAEFLGHQALASFLATILIFTGREAFSEIGGDILAFYIYTLYAIAITIAVLSLVRIIQYFNHSWCNIYLFPFVALRLCFLLLVLASKWVHKCM